MESIILDDHEVKLTSSLKLLGVTIYNNLKFDQHIHAVSKVKSMCWGTNEAQKSYTN